MSKKENKGSGAPDNNDDYKEKRADDEGTYVVPLHREESRGLDEEDETDDETVVKRTQLQRESARRPSRPGALAIEGPRFARDVTQSTTSDEESQIYHEVPRTAPDPVIMATLVSDEPDPEMELLPTVRASYPLLAHAEPADDDSVDVEEPSSPKPTNDDDNQSIPVKSPPSKGRTKNRILVCIIAVALLAIAGLTAGLVMAMRDEDDKKPKKKNGGSGGRPPPPQQRRESAGNKDRDGQNNNGGGGNENGGGDRR